MDSRQSTSGDLEMGSEEGGGVRIKPTFVGNDRHRNFYHVEK
jgi:hypothetical protein